MMGLSDSAYTLSWFCYYQILNLFVAVEVTAINAVVLKNVNFMVFFIYVFLYGTAVFGFAFFMATFFSRTKTALITTMVLYYMSYFIVYGF